MLHVVDNEQRDFEVRLNLALRLSLHGYKSILIKGSALSSIIKASKNCIVLGRLSANVPSLGELDTIHASSSSVFYFHDEGGFYNDLTYAQSVSRLHALPFLSHPVIQKVFFWGIHQLEIAKTLISSHHSKLCLAGSPRFDLYSSQNIHNVSTKSSLNSILIATRGGSIHPSPNHAHPLGKRIRAILSPDFIDQSVLERTLFGKWKKSAIDAVCLVDLISEISINFPNIPITIRPHPSEDPLAYRTIFGSNPNISVQPDGDITTLIENHSLLIGCDCTTGLEAILSRKLYINYRPIESRVHDQFKPRFLDKIGIVYEQKQDVINAIESFVKNPSIL